MVCCVLPTQNDAGGRTRTNWESFRETHGVASAVLDDEGDKLHRFETGLLQGLQYRKHGRVLLPKPLTGKVVQALRTMQLKAQDTLLCMPPELGGLLVQLEESFVTLAENRCDDAVRDRVNMGPYGIRIPPLEARVSVGQAPPKPLPNQRQCYMTFLPPSLLPRDADDQLSIGGKVVVILADPRYVLFRHREVWNRVRWMSSPAGSEFSPQFPDLDTTLEHYLESECHFGGHVMDRYREWMVEQQRAPHKVKILFVEDLVADPDLVMRGLAQFLEVDDPRIPSTAITALKAAQANGGLIKAGPTAEDELGLLKRVSKEFERCLARLSFGSQAKWSSSIRGFLAVADPRCQILAQQLLQHAAWQEPKTWAAHNLMMCKPCSFAPRGICRSAEDCNFCHVPGHAAPARRPSKKERMRRLRRVQRIVSRTPSPEGLSS